MIFIGARKESLKEGRDPSDCGRAVKEDLVEEPQKVDGVVVTTSKGKPPLLPRKACYYTQLVI